MKFGTIVNILDPLHLTPFGQLASVPDTVRVGAALRKKIAPPPGTTIEVKPKAKPGVSITTALINGVVTAGVLWAVAKLRV